MPLPNRSTASLFDADNKINNANVPPAVQQTDWDNTKLAPAISDVAALGLTAPRFWARVTLAASTGALVLLAWEAVWKNVTTTTPTLARSSAGVFTVTVPTVVSDEYDASLGLTNNITVALQGAQANLESTVFGFVNASASGNVITLHTADSSGSANDLVGSDIFVVAY
jgi:hypothetical protein